MRLEATSPFEGEDSLRQQSCLPQDSSKQQRGWTIPPGSFSKGRERIDGLTPMIILVIMPQDGWPWTRITLPLVNSFLKGRSGMSHGDKMLTSCESSQLVPLQLVFIVLDVLWIFIVLLVFLPGLGRWVRIFIWRCF